MAKLKTKSIYDKFVDMESEAFSKIKFKPKKRYDDAVAENDYKTRKSKEKNKTRFVYNKNDLII